MPQVPRSPVEIPVHVVAAPTCTGLDLSFLSPRPSSPYWLPPQHQSVPGDWIAQVCSAPPTATSVQVVSAPACTGDVTGVIVLPRPIEPYLFSPQHHRLPGDWIPQV